MKPYSNIGCRAAPLCAVAGMALMLGCLGPANASLLGDTVAARLFSPAGIIDDSTPLDLSVPVVVGAGVEIAAGDGTSIGDFMLPNEAIDFGASSIAVRLQAGGTIDGGATPVTGYAPGGRYVFSGLDVPGEVITGISFTVGLGQIANLAVLGTSWIALADEHTINLFLGDIQFVDYGGDSLNFANLTINLQTTVVPEPSIWLLLLCGLGGLVLARRAVHLRGREG